MSPLPLAAAALLGLAVAALPAALASTIAAVSSAALVASSAAAARVGLLVAAPVAGATAVSALIASAGSSAVSSASSAVSSAATASSITAASAATGVSSAASSSAGALRSFVDADGSAVKLNVVHVLDGVIGIGLLGESDKAESTAAAGVAVFYDDGLLDGTELLELGTEGGVIGVPGKAANE